MRTKETLLELCDIIALLTALEEKAAIREENCDIIDLLNDARRSLCETKNKIIALYEE